MLANGRAGNPPIADPGAELDAFTAALTVAVHRARARHRGGRRGRDAAARGRGHRRARSPAIARDIARSIAASSLVKAAIFGADPNWGRILATVGARAGSQRYAIDPHRATVAIQGVAGVRRGEPVLADRAGAAREDARARGRDRGRAARRAAARATAWGCDLGYDYVKLNADYTSLIVQTADGGLAKDDRLTNYSPSFKRTLLVEALSLHLAVRRHALRDQVRRRAMAKPALEQAFCDDIKLLRSVGLAADRRPRRPERAARARPRTCVDGVRRDRVDGLGDHARNSAAAPARTARCCARSGDGATRPVGAIIDAACIEMLLGQGYVPVISPIALGDDGAELQRRAPTPPPRRSRSRSGAEADLPRRRRRASSSTASSSPISAAPTSSASASADTGGIAVPAIDRARCAAASAAST